MNNVPYLVLECRVYSVLDNLPRETFVFSYQLHLSDTKAPGVNFINMFTCSFYSRRAQNCKKDSQVKQLFVLLGSAGIKAVPVNTLMKLAPHLDRQCWCTPRRSCCRTRTERHTASCRPCRSRRQSRGHLKYNRYISVSIFSSKC